MTAEEILKGNRSVAKVGARTPCPRIRESGSSDIPQDFIDALADFDNQRFVSMETAVNETLPDESYFAQVATLDAGLGRKEEAIREAKHAVELMPIAKDSWMGPGLVRNLALVYAWTGERDLAIEQLEMVAKIPFGPSYGDLRFNPCWDSLRGDPRFEKIVAKLAPSP